MDVDHVVNVQLLSCTVTWKQLSWQINGLSVSEADKRATVWDNEIVPWLLENCTSHYNSHVNGVWFANPSDAALFKLTWAGYFDK